ncbi:DUF504 domain-containing protein [Stetteria hydrogenophila]
MARRRSRIRQEVNRVLYSGDPSRYVIVYIDRDPETGRQSLRELPAARVVRASEWALLLDDGDTVIPLHRVVEVRERGGRVVWRRWSREGEG